MNNNYYGRGGGTGTGRGRPRQTAKCTILTCERPAHRNQIGGYCGLTHRDNACNACHVQLKTTWYSTPIDLCAACAHPSAGARTILTGPNVVFFYDRSAPFYEFTNFYARDVVIDRQTWKTTEHYYQASKFKDPRIRRAIQDSMTPREAFTLAKKYRDHVRKDWRSVSLACMEKAVIEKFAQHPDLRRKLLQTNNALLVEHTVNDNFYGDNGDGTGENHLGKILMKVRKKLKDSGTGRGPHDGGGGGGGGHGRGQGRGRVGGAPPRGHGGGYTTTYGASFQQLHKHKRR